MELNFPMLLEQNVDKMASRISDKVSSAVAGKFKVLDSRMAGWLSLLKAAEVECKVSEMQKASLTEHRAVDLITERVRSLTPPRPRAQTRLCRTDSAWGGDSPSRSRWFKHLSRWSLYLRPAVSTRVWKVQACLHAVMPGSSCRRTAQPGDGELSDALEGVRFIMGADVNQQMGPFADNAHIGDLHTTAAHWDDP
eukprot:1968522-Amphidinium_carterae.4